MLVNRAHSDRPFASPQQRTTGASTETTHTMANFLSTHPTTASGFHESTPILATSSHTPTDCMSSTALMVYRGIGAGVAWTIGVDLYALVGATETAWQEHLATRPPTTTKAKELARLLAKSCGRNVLLFGGFLTVFGGLTCSMEMARGRHDIWNPFVGGFASGLMIMPKEMYKTPKMLLGGAALCGASAMALYQFVPASSQGAIQEGSNGEEGEETRRAATMAH